MKVTFYIDYKTNWGESLYIVGNCKELGNNDNSNAIKMELKSGTLWAYTFVLPEKLTEFTYSFIVKHENGFQRAEWGNPHHFTRGKKISNYEIYSNWQDQPIDKSFFSSAFTDGIFKREKAHKEVAPEAGAVMFSIWAPVVRADEMLCVSGSNRLLGEWQVEKAIPLSDTHFPEWRVSLDVRGIKEPFSYKFVIVKKSNPRDVVTWEQGENRQFSMRVKGNESITVSGLYFNNPPCPWKGAGTAIPVFSLRSGSDYGVGDFYDLFEMVDWANATGQKIIQLLPINDTTLTSTWIDSYPYKANSSFALHPMYLRLDAVAELNDKRKMAYYKTAAQELNLLPEVDYERVNALKLSFMHDAFSEIGEEVSKTPQYITFIANNLYWLKPYAAFCALRDEYKTADFNKWGKNAIYNADEIERFCLTHKHEVDFIYFIQYFLDKQLHEVRDYAHSHGVVLKGDIPIGISRNSVDAWMYPQLFYMDCQAGAPPDDFSMLGQNWGFPTYNWEEMSKDGFSWWKNRFRKMSEYFDAYRIDHILGFFRIWQIPMNAVHGLLGAFNPALPFSVDELRSQYDFWLNKELHTQPYIMDYFLYDFFGEYLDEARSTFLESIGTGRYRLKDFVNTQAKVAEYFGARERNEKNDKIKDALMGLIDEVLFVEDSEVKDKYHPRIAAQYTYIYRSMTDYERWCFNRLYNDFYYHRHNDFWYGKAMWKLPPLINATNMLVCGEDLGMIPDCVSAVMKSQQILSLEIQRMPKDPKQEFGTPSQYPYLSVCTTSTHDMSGVRAWWEEDREKTQHFYNNMLGQDGEAPYYAEPWICDKIISMHLYSPAMFTILPLQDWLSVSGDLRRPNPQEEQINVPAESQHYWRYRMHITLEYLLEQKAFNQSLKDRIVNSGR